MAPKSIERAVVVTTVRLCFAQTSTKEHTEFTVSAYKVSAMTGIDRDYKG